MQKEIDLRVQRAAVELVPKLAIFATLTLIGSAITRWQKRQKRERLLKKLPTWRVAKKARR